jgi:hypothetical protein
LGGVFIGKCNAYARIVATFGKAGFERRKFQEILAIQGNHGVGDFFTHKLQALNSGFGTCPKAGKASDPNCPDA